MRRVLITGATRGIGRALVDRLRADGAEVIASGRDGEALARLAKASGVRTERADLADLSQVEALAERLRAAGGPLDAVVHGAGLIAGERRESADGHEQQLAVHHLAVVRLTVELLPALAPGATVLTVASDAHRRGVLDLDAPGLHEGYSAMGAYRRAKLAAVAWSLELGARAPALRAVAVHPGVVDTGIGARDTGGLVRLGWRLMAPLKVAPEEAAAGIAGVLDAPDASSAGWFAPRRISGGPLVAKDPAPRAADPALRRRLWDWSWAAAGLPGPAPATLAGWTPPSS